MKKKALIILLSSVAILIALIVTLALTIPFGSCGDKSHFIIIGNELTVSGSGTVSGFDSADESLKKVRKLTVKSGVTAIGEGAFSSIPSLESIYICDTVEKIAPLAFSSCASLQSFTVSKENQYFSTDENGVLFDKNQNTLICYPASKKDTFYRIPQSVSVISVAAFANAENLTETAFPHGLKDIENHAFAYCNSLREVTLPDGLTGIGTQSFFSCESLKRIIIPGSVKAVSTAALSFCKVLDEIDFVGTEEQWSHLLVEGNNNWSVTPKIRFIIDYGKCGENTRFVITRDRELIIEGIGSIDTPDTFLEHSNKILSITVYDGVTSIPEYAFKGLSRVENVSVAGSVKNIGTSAFDGFTSSQTIRINNTEAFVNENFSPLWNKNCDANIIHEK